MLDNLTVDKYIIAVLVCCSTVEDAYQGLSAYFRTDISQYLEIVDVLSLTEYVESAQTKYPELKSSLVDENNKALGTFAKWRDFFKKDEKIGNIIIELLSDLDIRGALYAEEITLPYLQSVAELIVGNKLKITCVKDVLSAISDALFQPYYLIPQDNDFELINAAKQELRRKKATEKVASVDIKRRFENKIVQKIQHFEVREELLRARSNKVHRIPSAHQLARVVESRETFRAFSLRVMSSARDMTQLPQLFIILKSSGFSSVIERYSDVLIHLELLLNNLNVRYINDILKILESSAEDCILCLKYYAAILEDNTEDMCRRFAALASGIGFTYMLAIAKFPNGVTLTNSLLREINFAFEEQNDEEWTRKEFICQLLIMFRDIKLMDLLADEKIKAEQIVNMANMYNERGDIANYKAFLGIFSYSFLLQNLRADKIDYAEILQLISVFGFLSAKKILQYMESVQNSEVLIVAVKYINEINEIRGVDLRTKTRNQLDAFRSWIDEDKLLLPFTSALSPISFLHKINLSYRFVSAQSSAQESADSSLPEKFIELMEAFANNASLHRLLHESLISSKQVIDLWYESVTADSDMGIYFARFLHFLSSEFIYIHLREKIFGWGEIKNAYNYSVRLCETVINKCNILSELIDFGDLYLVYFYYSADKIEQIIQDISQLASNEKVMDVEGQLVEYNQQSELDRHLKQCNVYRSDRFNRQIEFLGFVLHLHNFLNLPISQICFVVENVCDSEFARLASKALYLPSIYKPEIKQRFLLDFMLDIAPFIPSSANSNLNSFNNFVHSLGNSKLLQIIMGLFDAAADNELLLQTLHTQILNLIFSSDYPSKQLGVAIKALTVNNGQLVPSVKNSPSSISVHALEEILQHFQEQTIQGNISSQTKVQCELLLTKYLRFFKDEAVLISNPPLELPPRPRSNTY